MSDVPEAIDDASSTRPVRSLGRLRDFVSDRFNPKAYLGLHLTVALIIGSLGVWAFSALLDAVLDNATLVRLDLAAAVWMHAHVTAQGLKFFNWVSNAGSPRSMTIFGIVGALVLAVRRRFVMFIGWSSAFAGAGILESVLKLLVHRTRPAYGEAYVGHSFSFPSGHATMSFIGMTTLLYVLWVYWHPPRLLRVLSILAATAVIILVGVSRVYLGVHYPSDVLGGWAFAASWLAVCVSGVAFTMHYRRSR
ncbi:MAG TPA: phosphatase PAP2 family protein [Gemmatimonadaceae bacterium]|jgi:undecaprenyl-diphosphatase